jgi:hypothetical protein
MKVRLTVECDARVRETWHVWIPDDTPEGDVRAVATEVFEDQGYGGDVHGDDIEFWSEEIVENTEQDREVWDAEVVTEVAP